MNWQVYIIECSDDTLYTGITTDVERRFRQHEEGRGAKYFRGRNPLKVIFLEGGHDRSSASRRELQIKTMNRAEKHMLVLQQSMEAEKGLVLQQAKNLGMHN
ncbi:hypothetical protein OR1_02647 [Geobacter sp. OR-1]|uniref:GIY-YIG nuclease family protein n=1 Tax=Geobacter sp. OR-1 TaxID=1266765 RepID=UPI0005440AE5|nr:GIY-YIG nuclease family protein [Geobacter sp. OR-1]GAM10358.1 hypothetical protein OR1_02647 [Geobacter sp. OR-1]